jgi:hypothetical protein
MYRDVQRLLYHAERLTRFATDQKNRENMNISLMNCDAELEIIALFSTGTPARIEYSLLQTHQDADYLGAQLEKSSFFHETELLSRGNDQCVTTLSCSDQQRKNQLSLLNHAIPNPFRRSAQAQPGAQSSRHPIILHHTTPQHLPSLSISIFILILRPSLSADKQVQ